MEKCMHARITQTLQKFFIRKRVGLIHEAFMIYTLMR